MARFSEPAEHPPRRAAVVAAVGALDPSRLRVAAAELTAAPLTGADVDVLGGIAGIVPTEAVCRVLSLQPPAAVDDVEAVVRVIGRGEPATADADAAAQRLLALADVATVSLLYQNFDATAALIATTLGNPPAPAVPRTRRVAVADTAVGGRAVAAGTAVVVEIGAAGLPFGAGPHECPGRELAEAIVAGVLDAFTAGGYQVDPSQTELDPDGRPVRLVARPVAP